MHIVVLCDLSCCTVLCSVIASLLHRGMAWYGAIKMVTLPTPHTLRPLLTGVLKPKKRRKKKNLLAQTTNVSSLNIYLSEVDQEAESTVGG